MPNALLCCNGCDRWTSRGGWYEGAWFCDDCLPPEESAGENISA